MRLRAGVVLRRSALVTLIAYHMGNRPIATVVVKRWRALIHKHYERRKKIAVVFMNAVPFEYENSYRRQVIKGWLYRAYEKAVVTPKLNIWKKFVRFARSRHLIATEFWRLHASRVYGSCEGRPAGDHAVSLVIL
jgi:hypothetical protein